MNFIVSRQDTRRSASLVIILAISVFFAYSFLAYHSPEKFDSPDETANYFFSQRLANAEALTVPLPAELVGQTLTFPRNVWVIRDHLVPASFLGMIQFYGWIGRLTSPAIIVFLTPFFTALAVVCFFQLMQRIWGQRQALISAVLFALHPAVWYYSTRGMFHNALFVDLIIIGLWALTAAATASTQSQKSIASVEWRLFFYSLGGLALGEALAVRTSEAFWVLAMIAVLVVAFRRTIDFRFRFWIGAIMFSLPLIPLLLENSRLFGSPFSLGYSLGLLQEQTAGVPSRSFLETITNLALPFGVNVSAALANAWRHGVVLFWWMSVPTLLGFVMVVREIRQRRSVSASTDGEYDFRSIRLYTWIYVFLIVWLTMYYGSWDIRDAPNPQAVSIGMSYVRYWLPLFVFGAPFAAFFLKRLHSWFTARHAGARAASAAMLVAIALIALTLNSVFFNAGEGLAATRLHSVEYRMVAEETVKKTPANAVMISGRGDKIFFPERNVIYAVENDEQTKTLRRLAPHTPFYVYVSPTEALRNVETTWNNRGFELGQEVFLPGDGRLFRLEQGSNGE